MDSPEVLDETPLYLAFKSACLRSLPGFEVEAFSCEDADEYEARKAIRDTELNFSKEFKLADDYEELDTEGKLMLRYIFAQTLAENILEALAGLNPKGNVRKVSDFAPVMMFYRDNDYLGVPKTNFALKLRTSPSQFREAFNETVQGTPDGLLELGPKSSKGMGVATRGEYYIKNVGTEDGQAKEICKYFGLSLDVL